MSSVDTLAILKVGGFILTALATVWGLARKTTQEDAAGRKRLTPEGQIAVAIAVTSALVSSLAFGFETLARQQADRAAAERAQMEKRDAAQVRAIDRAEAAAASAVEAADRRTQAAEAREAGANQRALTIAVSERLRLEQSEHSERALHQIWNAATRVDPATISLALIPDCAADENYAAIFNDTTLTLKVWNEDGSELSASTQYSKASPLEMLALEQRRLPASEGASDLAIFSNFVTEKELGRYGNLDGWRGANIGISIEGNKVVDRDQAKELFHGHLTEGYRDDPDDDGEARYVRYPEGYYGFPHCESIMVTLLINGVMVGKTGAKPYMAGGPEGFTTQFSVNSTIEDDTLPVFPAAPRQVKEAHARSRER